MLRFDATMSVPIEDGAAQARRCESEGFQTLWTGESKHDPFLRCLLAADATDRLRVGTAVAIAFGRSPLTVATTAYDLARYTKGRFVLGLGSQVKPHIERRFSMPWSKPAARMREYVQALHAIWDSWDNDTEMSFDGEFYTHTLMPPFFRPPRHEFGRPEVFVAAVGERMSEVAGEVCDGLFFHPFNTRRYLQSVTLPAIMRGRDRAGRSGEGIALCGPVLTATGRTDAELDSAIAGVRHQIAFYASTPAYRAVLDLHGWGDIAPELTAMTKAGRWTELGTLVDDEMLRTFAVVGGPDEVASELIDRYGDLAHSISFSAPYQHDDEVFALVAASVRALSV
ncbi:TIGR03617 family F420-dependent LLM class oxidoreductase [Gordonia sp. ABSL11-1]|uniref:TIGR03617 family F420-dependent LLM class oxidoreductase n=1 Tax=Gordonia sp. ABSL11-1 TaxID=3053924 RepID=UPI002573FF76|nr:TIGR03617 family F420-dependent LLM class oxidoreductase [Gordonia sp. ABSL11-1]MDL9948591.1 TIGR03617 family F420-dependent LLM class oxidoreductase [Gordonia sp. ABSL11-1]